ncbi:hypothetical protein EV207_10742 [Scopulibacillus darangshiensis]|uniref:ABC-2 family transporter n=1 Tax=Scopulibacillus darangshiensis TaxID=442528 RepID=A0A4R2P6T5_9BACL|nr:hypothetical protein [Scopulibacillus darangshiensis]TCP29948.1 hypothetical protein EV207_10742 [Scopulibacillus darangshiensis]
MKRSKMLNVSFSGLSLHKKVLVMASIYCLIAVTCLLFITKKGKGSNCGIFDLMADIGGLMGSTNQLMFLIVAIPLIVLVLIQCIEKSERGFSVVKMGSRFHTWNIHVILTIYLSFIMTSFLLVISFIIAGFFVGFENTWLSYKGTISKMIHNQEKFESIVAHLFTYKIILTIFITKFLGFLMISFLTLFLKQFVKNTALIIIILIVIAGLDGLGTLPFSFFSWAASLNIRNWINPMITVYHCIYLFIVSMVFYGVTGLLYERKDFLS